MAAKIAGQSQIAALLTKRAVNAAFETTLTQGVATERALFLSLFGTAGQKEGMAAFVEKRKPRFSGL
jgi:enoyl-CoA hydratase